MKEKQSQTMIVQLGITYSDIDINFEDWCKPKWQLRGLDGTENYVHDLG